MVGDGDLENIFGNGDFDTCAEFTIAGQAKPLCVNGWFTAKTEPVTMQGIEVESGDPKFDAPTSLLTDVTTKISVTINGDDYIVERKQDNGTGITTVHLKTKRG